MSAISRSLAVIGLLLVSLLATPWARAEHGDPPGRVARVSHLLGDAAFSPAGEDVWLDVLRNRPLIRGDRLWTERNSRVEIQLGGAVARLGSRTSFEFLELNDAFAQMELTQGSLYLNVRRLHRGQAIEVATPALAFAIERAGRYRIDVDRERTTIAVWEGRGTAWGEHDNFEVFAGESVRFYGSDLSDHELYGLPRADSFDRYCFDRDQRLARSLSLRYVDYDLIGYADLDDHGSWRATRNYGTAWFPNVDAGWTPYRDGHWIWQDPWGWTWVDDSPWGFAPFHYGRWVHVGRWCWIPGPRHERPVYAPALVAFVGGRNWSLSISFRERSPIGWFPLGPNEAYVPWYQSSRDYFARVNAANTIINNTTITNVYNNYVVGRGGGAPMRYMNRDVAGAFTAVPSDVFVNSRPVRGAALQLDRRALTSAEFARSAPVAPSVRSVIGLAATSDTAPAREVLERRVLARTPPPQAERPFSTRESEQRTSQQGRGVATTPSAPPRGRPADARGNVRVLTDPQSNVDARTEVTRRSGSTPQSAPLPELDRSSERRDSRARSRDTQEMPTPMPTPTPRVDDEMRQPQADPRSATRQRALEQQRVDEQQRALDQQRQDEAARQQLLEQRNATRQRQLEQQQAEQQAREDEARQQRENERQRADEMRASEQRRRDDEARAQINAEREQERQRMAEQRAAENQRLEQERAEAGRRMEEAREQQRAAREAERERQAEMQAAEQERAEQRRRDAEERAQQQAERDAERERQAEEQAEARAREREEAEQARAERADDEEEDNAHRGSARMERGSPR